MIGLSVMNVRQFCNKNRIRTQTTLDDSEIEKEVTKSIVEVISEFLQNIGKENAALFLKAFANLFFISQQQVPDENVTPYMLPLSCVTAAGNYGRKVIPSRLRSMEVSISERKIRNALKKI